MFIPIGDEPDPPGYLPSGTVAVIAVNVAVYLPIALPPSLQAPDLRAVYACHSIS